MITIGIDPGLDGAICVLQDGQLLFCSVVPTIKQNGGRKYDLVGMQAIIKTVLLHGECQAFTELVGARPGQGVVSMFTFGKGAGIWIGMLSMAGIPFTEVRPQEWKKVMLAGMDKSDKSVSVLRAQQLCPYFQFRASERSKIKHHGMAESYLIAEYGRRCLNGQAYTQGRALHHNTLNTRKPDDGVV